MSESKLFGFRLYVMPLTQEDDVRQSVSQDIVCGRDIAGLVSFGKHYSAGIVFCPCGKSDK